MIKTISASKLDRLRTEGNVLPIMLLDIDFHIIGDISNCEFKKGTDPKEICFNAVQTTLREIPVLYRDTVYKRAWKTAQKIHNSYLVPQLKDTTKILMVLHTWIFKLSEDGLIDLYDQRFVDMLEEMSDIFFQGQTKGYIDGNNKKKTGEDVLKRRLSALKRVQKLHDKCVNYDLYLSIRNENNKLELVK